MTTLRQRCQAVLDQIMRDGILRQGNAVDTLLGFMVAEEGRRADERLAESLPLVLYFVTDADRDEFIAMVREAKPNMITKKMP